VLLVDELDHLVTRKQTVLYNLFDWPTRPQSNLVVIGIANTMDLDERLLKRIASRLGLRKIQFRPYTKEQLANIIKVATVSFMNVMRHSFMLFIQNRLGGLSAFDTPAIEFCASKVIAHAAALLYRCLHVVVTFLHC
jgi:origin recognition complex subunit 1